MVGKMTVDVEEDHKPECILQIRLTISDQTGESTEGAGTVLVTDGHMENTVKNLCHRDTVM